MDQVKQERYADAIKVARSVCTEAEYNNEGANMIFMALIGKRAFQYELEAFYKENPMTLAKDVAKEAYSTTKDLTAKGFSSVVQFAKKNLKK